MKIICIINSMLLSVIIPVYNEINAIRKILEKVEKVPIKKEILIVDDCSTDGTREFLKKIKKKNYKIFFHKKNSGKGSAIITASKYISGEICIIQDADLEYNPNDYLKIINPILKKKFKVVYGSRILKKKKKILNRFTSFFRFFANFFLTSFSNFINKQNLTDAHTCYKAFETSLFRILNLKEKRFNFCPEVTTKLSNLKIEIFEVPIFYNGRTRHEGKKITFWDGLEAIFTILKYKYGF